LLGSSDFFVGGQLMRAFARILLKVLAGQLLRLFEGGALRQDLRRAIE